MLESGIAFALITAIVFAYYRTENINKKRIVVAASLGLGFLAGVVSAVLRSVPNLLNRTNLNFFSVIPIVLSMIFLFLLPVIKNKIRDRVYENLTTAGVIAYVISSSFYYMPLILLQSNSFVYYGESAVSTMVLYRVLGFCFAILTMIISAAMVHTAATKLEKKYVSVITVMSLLMIGITQINVIVQRLYSLRILPKNRLLFQTIALISNHANVIYFVVMLFLATIPVLVIFKNRKVKGTFSNRAELRKAKYLIRHKRRISAFLLFILVFNVFSLTFVKSYAYREVPLSPPEDYEIVDGAVTIPLEVFDDDLLHRYEYKSKNGISVRFIIIKKQGSYGVCLDACEICGPSGYFMRENDVVCKLCDVVMNKGTIGFKGGCNPIPIPFIVHDRKMKIFLDVLDEQDYIFK